MKIILFVIFILCTNVLLNAQNITTVDSIGCFDIGMAAFDTYGNLYFESGLGNKIMKMDTNYVTSVVAGTGSIGYSGDNGPATNATIDVPGGITVDTIGNVYFADSYNQRVRKIDVSTGIITTIAGIGIGGIGTGGFSGDGGPASAAQLNVPLGVCFDKLGNLCIVDGSNYRIRKITTDGIINTIVGNGVEGLTSGDDGPATAARCYPADIVADNFGNIFFTQPLSTIRKVNSLGIISTIAGDTISHIYNGDGIPATSANIDPYCIAMGVDGLLYISDASTNNRIRVIDLAGIIHTAAGNGISGNGGDSGPATAAEFYGNTGIAFDKCGNLFIGQVNDPRIRKVSFNPACWPEEVNKIPTYEINIYPNPAITEINVNNITSETNYAVFNIVGIIEQSGTLEKGSNSINIKALPPALYLLELTDEDGRRTVRKVVKE